MNVRERGLLVATGLVLGGALLFTQVLEPGWKKLDELNEEHGLLEDVLDREREHASRPKALATERAAVWGTLAPPPQTSLVPWLMEHVRGEAKDADFEPTSLRFVGVRPLGVTSGRRGAKSSGPFVEVRLELRARVRFRKLHDFLCRLAASDRHVRVQSIDVKPRKGSDTMDVQLQLVALAPRESYRGLDGEAQR